MNMYKTAGMAALMVGLVLTSAPANAGPPPAGVASAMRATIDAATVVERTVVVVRRGPVVRRPVVVRRGPVVVGRPLARCVWVRGRRVCR